MITVDQINFTTIIGQPFFLARSTADCENTVIP